MATVSARIRVEVEIVVGAWNGKSTFDELHAQVQREGLNIARSIFEDHEIRETPRGHVVGPAKVLFVTVSEDTKGSE